ncbi:MAG: hypothetical protein ACTS73_08870 [Arsenophonus sp. NEOnobi-MAG3]
MGQGHSLMLQRYRYKISDRSKRFNNLTGTLLVRLHHKDKWFSYLQYILNSLTLLESAKQTSIDLKTAFIWYQCFFALSMIAKT